VIVDHLIRKNTNVFLRLIDIFIRLEGWTLLHTLLDKQ